MEILKVHDLTKNFNGLRALDAVSFTVEKNSITALIGPNGAGKTTLFDIITGFLKADDGIIYVDDMDVNALEPHQISKIGVSRTFQELKLFEEMSVLDNVLVAIKYKFGHEIFSAFFKRFAFKREEKIHLLGNLLLETKTVGVYRNYNQPVELRRTPTALHHSFSRCIHQVRNHVPLHKLDIY